MKKIGFILVLLLVALIVKAQESYKIDKSSFDIINLDSDGLEHVKKLVNSGNYEKAATSLLAYYRQRTTVKHLDFNIDDKNKLLGKKLDPSIQAMADSALLHKFKPHKGYPYYDYGNDINWQYQPVKDQLIKTFLHRTTFWESLGKAYWATGNEKYAKEWVFQIKDWIKKNKNGAYPDDKSFAWKAFIVSFRLNHWSGYFNMFINSSSFTPAFLMEFLNSYAEQAEYVKTNYTDIGNHLLYEALHMMYAGSTFPEMNNAASWRKSGIQILNTEISKQVLADGVQFELSTSYHIGTINIFLNALKIAQLAGVENEFPESYRNLVEKMVLAVHKYSFPDYTFPMYGNSFLTAKRIALKHYKNWFEVFPQNKIVEYFATDGKSGKLPNYLSAYLPDAGFYAFRNGWDMNATVMQIKSGPAAHFHSHPDNGTFELWVKGRNFTPDAGSFIYANEGGFANKKRDWYRSTKAHQTLTLNNANIENKSQLQKWETSDQLDRLSYINPSYKNLNHLRSILFIDKEYFIIIDRAIGEATGNLGIHFVLKEDSNPVTDKITNKITTTYKDGNNLIIQCFNKEMNKLIEEESFVSYEYQKESSRPAYVFEQSKPDNKTKGFITIVYPFAGVKAPEISLKELKGHNLPEGNIHVELNIDGKRKPIKINL